ncbi:MAG: FG-GAP-like repeat-containing protein [Anaerolineae bacterium]
MKRGRLGLVVTVALTLLFPYGAGGQAKHASGLQAPVPKWIHGGCYSSWCETGWYSSPAVADLDADGSMEVIASAYSVVVLDAGTGAVEWRVASGHDRSEPQADSVGRTWPGIAVADVDDDGDLEIITAHGRGYVSVYDHLGYFAPGWPQTPTDRELRGLAVYDLEGDGLLEVIVTGAVLGKVNVWVYDHDGTLRSGWPQLADDSGHAWGVFNDNAAVGDLDGDGVGEIVVPSDVHYICAYEPDGTQIPAHPMYDGKGWGQVGVWESLTTELRGWGTCDAGDVRAERYRANFAHGPAAMADLNGDGTVELVAVGNVYDCIPGYPSRYNGVYVFNSDRSRFVAEGYDWQAGPVDTGAPLSEDYGLIENNQPNPVVADLDGDGQREILYASYDGRVHAFWLDKTEHGNWPYAVYQPTEGLFRFASEPVVVDLEGDGQAEVIFASWVQKGTGQTGQLHVLDYHGTPLYEVSLSPAFGSPDWNGALAAPTLANLDDDADLEIVLNTAHSGFVAYDLPGSGAAEILWGTGRGNYQRTGSILHGTLRHSRFDVAPHLPKPGALLTYTLHLVNPGPDLPEVRVTNTLSAGVQYVGNLWASAGVYEFANDTMHWQGMVVGGQGVTITYAAQVSSDLSGGLAIVNTAQLNDGLGHLWLREAVVVVNGHALYLPLVQR